MVHDTPTEQVLIDDQPHGFTPAQAEALDTVSSALMNPGLVKPAGQDHSWAAPLLPALDNEYDPAFSSGLAFWKHMDNPKGRGFYKISPDTYNKELSIGAIPNYMNRTRLNSYHVKFSLEGDPSLKEFFHALLWEIDTDYPLTPMAKPTEVVKRCKKCRGFLWEQTILEPKDLKKLAKQIGLRCTEQMWKAAKKCHGELEEVPFGRLQLGAM